MSQSPERGTLSRRRAIGRILRLAYPYRWRLAAAIVLWVIASSTFLAVPMGVRELVDAAFAHTDRRILDRLALALVALFLAQAVVSFVANYLLSATGERIVADFRKQVYGHLQTLSLRYFENERTGDLMARLTSDVGTIRTAVTGATSDLISLGLRAVGSGVLLLALSWRLGLLILIAVPLASVATQRAGSQIRRLSREIQDRLADATAVAEDALSAIRLVTAFARNAYEVARYSAAVDALLGASLRRIVLRAALSSVLLILFFTPIAAIFWFGGIEVMSGRLSAGALMAAFFYASNISQCVGSLSGIYTTFVSAVGASERVFEILDQRSEIAELPGARGLPRLRGVLRFENVHFGYAPALPVLRGIDLEIQPGERVAVVGPSGIGKTTLLHLIPRFFDPTAGRITLDDIDLRSLPLARLREQIAVVTQDVQLFNGTVESNIRYGRLDASHEDVRASAAAADADVFIGDLAAGYETVVGQRGVKLSGGQRQRISVARALLKEAPILVLDEPTSSIDGEAEFAIKQTLRQIPRDRTIIIVAHRIATIRDADRIAVLDGGRVVETGTHVELIRSRGAYYRLFARQFAAGGELLADRPDTERAIAWQA